MHKYNNIGAGTLKVKGYAPGLAFHLGANWISYFLWVGCDCFLRLLFLLHLGLLHQLIHAIG